MDKQILEQSITIDAAPERVWQALTAPAELVRWLMPPMMGAEMERDGAGVLTVRMGPMQAAVAIVEDAQAPHHVTLRSLPDQTVAIRYTLEPEKKGTRVTVTMTGTDALSDAARSERSEPSGEGWNKALANLKAFVEGKELPFPEGYVGSMFGYRRNMRGTVAIARSIWIRAARERVWQAITEPKQIQQWFSPGSDWRSTGLHVGGMLAVSDPQTGKDLAVQLIEVFEPPRHLVTREAAVPPQPVHVTDWVLDEESGGTRVTLTFSGFEQEPVEMQHMMMEQHTFGFGMMMQNLKASIEGDTLPYPQGF